MEDIRKEEAMKKNKKCRSATPGRNDKYVNMQWRRSSDSRNPQI